MRLRTLTVPVAAAALAFAGPAAPAFAHGEEGVDKVVMKDVVVPQTEGGISKNMEFVKNVRYPEIPAGTFDAVLGSRPQAGSDIEFGRIGGKDYAFAGTLRNGMQIVDITDPANAQSVAIYDCKISQGDIQVFSQGDRVLATYTADGSFGAAGVASQCGQDLLAKGVPLTNASAGTVMVDVTDPTSPTTLGFAAVPEGSHNITVHPSGKYMYNSNSDLLVRTPIGPNTTTSTSPKIDIFDISTPETPVKLPHLALQYVPLSLGSESHDVTFSADGTRAYSAALSQTLVIDTEDPAKPRIISQIIDPTVQLSHGADPIRLKKKDGTFRDLLLISDEQAGAAAGTNCPGGGVHVYDITGSLETSPKKLGVWFIGETKPSTATCTAHVFRMHGDQGLFTIAWYDQGVRVVDVAGLADLPTPAVPFVTSGNGNGIREIGRYTFDDHNTWSFKTNKIGTDGSFFGFGNDLGRGLDVYKFDGTALGRTVPALEPTDLKLAPATTAPEATKPGKSDGKSKGKGPKKAEALPLLPLGGGSGGPGTGALAGLAALVAMTGAVAAVRRTGGTPALA
jgi:hypothetical protein